MELSGNREKKCQNSSAFKGWNMEAYIWYYVGIGAEGEPPAYLLYMGVASEAGAMGRSGRSGRSGQLGALRTIRTLQAGRGLK